MKPTRIHASHALLLLSIPALLNPGNALAQVVPIVRSGSATSLAFARYVASVQKGNAVPDSGPVGVVIEASLPGLYKQSAVLAIRQTDEAGLSRYQVLQIAGDVTVLDEVVAPYLLAQAQIEGIPVPSVAITPANYRFKYLGEIGSGDATAYMFRITPRRKRTGLIEGQLWIHAASGAEVLQTGHFVRPPSAEIPRMGLVRETKLLAEDSCVRITHVTMDTLRVGRAELTITEYRLGEAGEQKLPQFPGGIISQ